MTNLSSKLTKGIAEFSRAVEALVAAEPRLIGDANPPDASGVYAFVIGDELVYVGEAKGSGGLRDRILQKHLAGDEGHALQRYFRGHFPDRMLRREHIKRAVLVKWVVVENSNAVSVVERMAIWLLNPPLNRT
jgi:hypothetical protein